MGTGASLTSSRLEIPGDVEQAYERLLEEGYTDGLPIIPPTEDRVLRMVEYMGRDPGEVITHLDPEGGAATVEKIAVNAVMAGCLPQYMPILIAAIEAMAEPEFNLHGIQCTTSPVGPMVIINGPIRKQIGLNCGRGVLGPGWRANATIGRAIRLILINIGGAAPGPVDQAIHGQPAKYTLCMGENEEESVWDPLHVERGFRREESTVTVVSVQSMINSFTTYKEAESITMMIADGMAHIGANLFGGGDLVIITPGHAMRFAEQGYSKERLKEEIWEKARVPRERIPNEEPNVAAWKTWVWDGDKVRVVREPSDLLVLVAGGPEPYHVMYCAHWAESRPVIKPIPMVRQ